MDLLDEQRQNQEHYKRLYEESQVKLSEANKKITILEDEHTSSSKISMEMEDVNDIKYIMGSNTDRITLRFKIFSQKRQKKASKVYVLNTTIGDVRQYASKFGLFVLSKDAGISLTQDNTLYFSYSWHIQSIFRLFEALGSEITIPKKYNENIELYAKSIYDTLLYSTRAFKLE